MTQAKIREIREAFSYKIDKSLERSLNSFLASEVVLYFKTKKSHWFAAGPNFKDVHEMLDEQAEFMLKSIDQIAERIVMLGGAPIASLDEFEASSVLNEFPVQDPKSTMEQLEDLTGDHHKIILGLRSEIDRFQDRDDPGTADLLTRLVQKHEKAAWFLRETIQRPGQTVSR